MADQANITSDIVDGSAISSDVTSGVTINTSVNQSTTISTNVTTGGKGENGVGVPIGGTTGQVLSKNTGTDYDTKWVNANAGSGTVTSVAATGSNGVNVTGSPITSSGSLTIGLGAITPTSIASTGSVTGTNLSGTNTGDQNLTPYATLASPTFTGDPKAPTATAGDNDTSIATTAFVTGAIASNDALDVHLAGTETITGVKTFTGSPVISTITNTGTLTLPTSTDILVGRATTDTLTNKNLTSGTNTFPTFNQSTTGSAATLTTPRTIGTTTGDVTSAGSSFNGSANNTNALTLATVNSNVGTFGTASSVGSQTVNAKGLTTSASSIPIQITESQVTNLTTDLAGKLHNLTSTTVSTTSTTVTTNTKQGYDATSGTLTATLPASATQGDIVFIQKTDASINVLNISGNINGTASSTLPIRTQLQGKLMQWTGATWEVIGGDLSLPSLDARYIQTSTGINGYITAGSNVILSGTGTTASPYTISSTAAGGGGGTVTNVTSTSTDLTVANGTTTPALTLVSAPKLTTARNINGVAFDGTANITVADGTKEPIITAGTTSQYYRGDKTFQTLNQDVVPDGTTNKAYTATDKNRLANTSGTNTGDQTTITGNAGTATTLQTARLINGVSFNGSADITTPSSAVVRTVTQTTHGFSVGALVYYNGTTYIASQANSAANASVTGIVSTVINANSFILTTEGPVTGLTGLTSGTQYFLSPTTAGTATTTEPSTAGQVSKPVYVADSTTTAIFHNYRGIVIATSSAGDMVLSATQTVTGPKTFNNNTLLLAGSTSGTTTMQAAATAGTGTVILPTTGTLATTSNIETLQNKTISGAANTITNISLTTGVTGTLPVTNGGTGVTTSTGSGANVLGTSPTITTPLIGQFGTASGLGASWITWTPTLTNITLGTGGTTVAKYIAIGKTIHWRMKITLGSSGSAVGTSPKFTLPVATSADYAAGDPMQTTVELSGTARQVGTLYWQTSTQMEITYVNASAQTSSITATAPFTWTAGNQFLLFGTYESI